VIRRRPRPLLITAAICAVGLAIWAALGAADSEPAPSATPPDERPALEPTADAAVDAAAGFLSSMTLDTLLSRARRQSVLAVYADPSARPGLEQLYARERRRVAASYRQGPRVARAALLGYRVDGLSSSAATVSLWAATIGGSGSYGPTTGWTTIIVDLTWTARGWRVSAVDERPGPSGEWPIESLASEAKTFRAFRYAP